MLNCLSTRNKLSSQDKTQCSTRFFKKLSTDENERNYINYLDKFALPRGNASCKNILTVAQLARNEEKKNSKGKKMLLSHATKSFKTLMSVSISDKENKCLRKEHSTKNLKLTASVELPQLLTKSISQTTVNRKMDEGKLRLLEKAGFRRKIEKCAGEKDEKGIERIPGERVQDKTVERLLLERTNEKPKKKDPQLKISQFRLGKKLGSGRFGNVYIA